MEPRILPNMKLWRALEDTTPTAWSQGTVDAVWLTPTGDTLARCTWAVNNALTTLEAPVSALLAEFASGRLLTTPPTLSPKLAPLGTSLTKQREDTTRSARTTPPLETRINVQETPPPAKAHPVPRHKPSASLPSTPLAHTNATPPPTGSWRGSLKISSNGTSLTCSLRQLHLGAPFISPSLPPPSATLRVVRRVGVESVFASSEGALLATADISPAAEALERELKATHAAAVLEAEPNALNHIFLLPLSSSVAQSIIRKPAYPANTDGGERSSSSWLLVFISKRKMLGPPSKPAPPNDSRNKAAIEAAAAAAAAAMADRLPSWLPSRAAFVVERYCTTREGAERAAAVARVKGAAPAYQHQPGGGSDRERTVWINRIPEELSSVELVDLFSMCGEVTCCTIIREASGRRSSNHVFAFIEFATVAEAAAALQLSGLVFTKRVGGGGKPPSLTVAPSRSGITKTEALIRTWERLQRWRCVKPAASPAEATGSPGSAGGAARFKRRAHASAEREEPPAKRTILQRASGEGLSAVQTAPQAAAAAEDAAVAFLKEMGEAPAEAEGGTPDLRFPAL